MKKRERIDDEEEDECYEDVEMEGDGDESGGEEATRTTGSWVHRVEGECSIYRALT